MTPKKKRIIAIAVLVAVAAGIFFYVRVPGTAIRGLRDVSPEYSRVTVDMIEYFYSHVGQGVAIKPNMESTITTFELESEQIEMLRDLMLNSTFRRATGSGHPRRIEAGQRHVAYAIAFNDIPNHKPDHMSIWARSFGYFDVSSGGVALYSLRIIGSGWEDALLEILALTPEYRVTVRD